LNNVEKQWTILAQEWPRAKTALARRPLSPVASASALDGAMNGRCPAARAGHAIFANFPAAGTAAMQRVTLTIDDDLMESLDKYMEASGHQNRSEAVRDLVRASLARQPAGGEPARSCMAALVYVYDHDTRQLAKRLTHDHHSHADMSVATLHVHIDAQSCLEVSLLRGRKSEVQHFAQHIIAERGVRYGELVVVPAEASEGAAAPHHAHGHEHAHDHAPKDDEDA
jgi:CopG family transcriptional regulator, nickel-responsive regulator